MDGLISYPSHLIDPREKGREWIMQYCKAAWRSFEKDIPRDMFYHARFKYEIQKHYANGNQPINKYKPLMGVDEDARETNLNIDWSVIPIIPKFRRIALGKLNKVDYNIVATPVDSLANNEINDYFGMMKAKLALREAAKKIDPQLLESPELQLSQDDAKDLEELEIKRNYTFKHNMSIEAEQAIKVVFEQNGITALREKVREDLFDHGVGGYKEWIDSNGAIKIRAINPRNIVTSYCRNGDFSDVQHMGEVLELSISDLKQMAGSQFTDEEYEDIARNVAGRFGNPRDWPTSLSVYNRGYDTFKIRVLDLEFYSVNESVYEQRVDRRGNVVYARGRYEDRNRRKEKYERIAYKVVYKAKWIMDTEYMFDYGLMTDMKRAKSSLMDTRLSYHIISPQFYDMKGYGMMDQLIPIADQIQISWYRMQNAINQSRPKGIMIEMGALEDIPLGSGGTKLTPMKVLDLYNKTGTLVYRKMDQQGRMTNYKPIEELENGLGRDVMNYWQMINNNIQLLRDVTGINEMTDGSTPDPRTLTTVAKLAYEGTNNALNHIVAGERKILQQLANDIILRIQDVAANVGISGYVNSLGSATMKFFKTSPALSLYEFGIILDDKPTDDQKAMLMQQVQAGQMNQLLDIEDVIIIQNTDNLKVAQQLLAYKIKKRREQIQQESMQQQQMNAQVQTQSAQAAEQAKQQTLSVEMQLKAEMLKLEKEYDLKLMSVKYDFEIKLEQIRQSGKIGAKDLENKGKKSVQKIKMGQIDDDFSSPSGFSAPIQGTETPSFEDVQAVPSEDEMPEEQPQPIDEESENPEEQAMQEGAPEEQAQGSEMPEGSQPEMQ